MKTKRIFFVLVIVCVLGLLNKGQSASRFSASVLVEAPASSGSLSGYSRGCAVKSVYSSSNSVSVISNWVQLISTNPIESITAYSSFGDSAHRSPAMTFPVSTITTNGYMPQVYKVIDFGEDGISFSTAPYIYKSAATSGQANRVWLEIIP